jgi:hypothetical protein
MSKTEPLGLIACKVIMRSKLSSSAKAVGAVLLDHVNWKSLRCDPGEERIAELTGYARSSVQSAIAQLRKEGFLVVDLHGGQFGKNQYTFAWDVIRDKDRQHAARHRGRGSPEEPGLPRPESRAQTRSGNPIIEPVTSADSETAPERPDRRNGQPRQGRATTSGLRTPNRPVSDRSPSRNDVAVSSAERRWTSHLMNLLRPHPDECALVLDHIDEDLKQAATAAELARRGAGIHHLVRALQAKDGIQAFGDGSALGRRLSGVASSSNALLPAATTEVDDG